MPTPTFTQHCNAQPPWSTEFPSHLPTTPLTTTLPTKPSSTPVPTPSPLPTTPRKSHPSLSHHSTTTSSNENITTPHTPLPALPRVRKPSTPFPPITPSKTPTRSAVRSVVVGTPETPRTPVGRMREWRMETPRDAGDKGFQGTEGFVDGDGLGDVEMVDVNDVMGRIMGMKGQQEVGKDEGEMDWMMEVEDK